MVHQARISHCCGNRLDYRGRRGNNAGIVIFRSSIRLYSNALLAPALLWAASSAAAAGTCVVDSELSAPLTASDATLTLARPATQAESFEALCNAQGLAELIIEIQPGQRLALELLIQHPQAATARLSAGSSDRSAKWLEFDPAPGQQEGFWRYPLKVSALAEFEAGDRLELVLEVSLAENSFNREIPITLIVQQEAPLFRNRFEVDPVLGQFSYRLPPPQSASDAARAKTLILAALSD